MISRKEYDEARSWAWNLVKQAGIPVIDKEYDRIEVADLGLGELTRTGLQILTLASDEWLGAKLLVFRPNQFFPQHRHPPSRSGDYPGKTELLRVHFGTVHLFIDGESTSNPGVTPPEHRLPYCTVRHELILSPGEQHLCPPNSWHWFQAGAEGAVTWSISSKTTDTEDIFADPQVTRKTVIEQEFELPRPAFQIDSDRGTAMIQKELVYAQINHQETTPLPYTLDFEMNTDDELDAYYRTKEWREKITNAILRVPSPINWVEEDAQPFYEDAYGCVWRTDRRPFHLEKAPLSEPDLDKLTLPNIDGFFTQAWKEEAEQFIKTHQDRFLVISYGFGLFERSWVLRGFQETLMDSAADPEFYDAFIEVICDHQAKIVERFLELPIDGIMFSDDWGYQRGLLIRPEMWRTYFKPRYRKLYKLAHDAGKKTLNHSCGNVADIIPDLIEIGLDVLQSVQPEAMAPYRLKQKYGNDITFWGGLGSQSTIQFGTPAEIHEEVEKLSRVMGRGGGYILSPAKHIQPGTPVQNSAAVYEAFLKYSTAAKR